MGFEISKTVLVLPKKHYSNNELIEKFSLNTSNEWIKQRTGFESRHFIESIKEFEEIICETAKRLNVNGLDGIIVASSTNPYKMPGLSQIIHNFLKCDINVNTLDINGACNGFMQGLLVAKSWLNEGCNKVMVLGADAMSTILDFDDRATCCLFGDACAGVLLEKNETKGILGSVHFTDSSNYEALQAKEYLKMNGRYVFEQSYKYFDKSITQALTNAKKDISEIDYFVLHQANYRILKYFAQRKNIKQECVPFFASHWGNISAATIPAVLNNLKYENKQIVLAGFGAGFTSSAVVLSC